MLLTHWILEFMKQVLPRLLRPVAPFSVGTGRGNKDKLSILTSYYKVKIVARGNQRQYCSTVYYVGTCETTSVFVWDMFLQH